MADPSPVSFLFGVLLLGLVCILVAVFADLLFGRHDWPGEDE
jgi:ABC-type transport system involved in cytochrome c biogenesis permease subunit